MNQNEGARGISENISQKKSGIRSFKLSHDPVSEYKIFKEMSINIDQMNDKMPTNEELTGRMENKSGSDRDSRIQ